MCQQAAHFAASGSKLRAFSLSRATFHLSRSSRPSTVLDDASINPIAHRACVRFVMRNGKVWSRTRFATRVSAHHRHCVLRPLRRSCASLTRPPNISERRTIVGRCTILTSTMTFDRLGQRVQMHPSPSMIPAAQAISVGHGVIGIHPKVKGMAARSVAGSDISSPLARLISPCGSVRWPFSPRAANW